MSQCKECDLYVPENEQESHAQDVHPALCDEKLQGYVQDSVNDAVTELFED